MPHLSLPRPFDVRPQLYRDKAEVEEWMARDPIKRFGDWAIASGEIHSQDVEAIEARVADEVDKAVAFAEAGQWEPIADLMKHVGAERRP